MKANRGIAGIIVFDCLESLLVYAVLTHVTLEVGPGLDQRAIRGEVFIAGPAFLAGEVIELGEEPLADLNHQHALIVLGEDPVVEAPFAELTVQESQPE